MAEKENTSVGNSTSENVAEDAELDELLADALNDFGKPPPEAKNVGDTPKAVEAKESTPNPTGADDLSKFFGENFEREMLSALAANFNEDLGIDPSAADELTANFRKVAEETAKAFSEQNLDGEFSATINQALKNLSEGAENLQNIFSDESVMKMFTGLPNEGSDDLLPFIQQMMQTLLSKDILYPALKDLLEKYDVWLEENRSRLEASEFNRYKKQQSLIKDVCSILESESELDSIEVKKQRFDSLIGLMHQVQDCGQPPKELMDSIKPFEDMPNQPDPTQCSVM